MGINTLSDQYNQQSEVARLQTVALNAQIQLESDLWLMAEILQLDPNVFPRLVPIDINEPPKSEFLDLGLEPLYALSFESLRDYILISLRFNYAPLA